MNFEFTCFYCGKKWNKSYYYKPDFDSLKCPDCDDKKIKIVNVDKSKIDYYAKK